MVTVILFLDINECDNTSLCSENGTCKNIIGSFQCRCDTGFNGNGTHCEGGICRKMCTLKIL